MASLNKIKEEAANQSTDFVVFHSAPVTGSGGEIRLTRKDMTLSSRIKAMFWTCISSQGISLQVSKLVARWCPAIEPTSETSLRLTVNYDIMDDTTSLNDKTTIMTLTGRMSEVHQITLFPSRPLLYPKSSQMRFPWSVIIDTGDIEQQTGSPILGVMKVWCHIDIRPYSTTRRMVPRMYTPPHVEWENRNFAFYVPMWCQMQARGIIASDIKKTLQYDRFVRTVARHLEPNNITDDKIVPMMQTMSQDDYNQILFLTEKCLLNKGGSYCNCNKDLSVFMDEIECNRSTKYNNHAAKIKKYSSNAHSGRYQHVPTLEDINF